MALKSSKHNVLSRLLWICSFVIILCSWSQAQERCDFEIKIQLASQQTQAVLASLNANWESTGQVYFFDTAGLDLLSTGVIVRLRRGSRRDLTVKVRPPEGTKFYDRSGGEKFKCEVDLIAGAPNYSYSVQSQVTGDKVPATGPEIYSLLSAGQKDLLKQARVSIDWTQVKTVAEIQSTDWRATAGQSFNKLALELWEWPAGRILELSTKVRSDDGPSTYTELNQLLVAKGISLSGQQQLKTTMVLETLARHAAN